MSLLIYLDGKFVPEDEAKVSVFDHGLLYGDGVFEGIRSYNCNVFKLKEHIDRLYESAKYINLVIPMKKEEMTQVVVDSLVKNNISDGYIRLVVTRGKGDLGLSPTKCPKATVFCIAASIQLYPEELYEKGLTVITAPTLRTRASAFNPKAKSLNYLNNIMAKMECENAGAAEALMLSDEGYVVECTGDNIFIIKDKVITTPPEYIGALKGISRDTVIESARKLGYTVKEEVFTRFDVYNAEECFLTGTAAEAIPMVKIDGRNIGDGKPGEITKLLIEEFRKVTEMIGVKYEL